MSMRIKRLFANLPVALQDQVLFRVGAGIGLGILSLGIIFYTKTWILGLSSLILMFFMIVNGVYLLYNCYRGKYVVVSGRCAAVERTGAKKRAKAFRMITDDGMLTVHISCRRKIPSKEDEITLYLPLETPVYEVDGGYCIYRFYALEICRKV